MSIAVIGRADLKISTHLDCNLDVHIFAIQVSTTHAMHKRRINARPS